MDGDTEPLMLDTDNPYSDAPPPVYSELVEPQPVSTPTPIASNPADGGPSELPPPYYPTPHVMTTHVTCKVCCYQISLESRHNLLVIKCPMCHEATPIKTAPPGKKYVRCPCNCLLICGVEAVRIACPRVNCRKVIRVQQPIRGTVSNIPTVRIQCVYCDDTFMFQRSEASTKLARCDSCGKVSFVGWELKKKKLLLFGILGALFLLCGAIVTVVTVSVEPMTGIYFVWIGAFLVGVLNLIRGAYWASVKVSHPVEGA